MFAYCQNDPVRYIDSGGTFICTITGAIIGGIIGAINAAIEGDDIGAGAAIGAATGALAGFAADAAIATGGVGAVVLAAAGGAAAGVTNYVANEYVNGRKPQLENIVLEGTVGAVSNLITFGVGGGTLVKTGGKLLTKMANNFVSTIMKGTTKTVAGKVVYKTAKTVAKHICQNSMMELAMTAATSGGAWLNSKAWGGVVGVKAKVRIISDLTLFVMLLVLLILMTADLGWLIWVVGNISGSRIQIILSQIVLIVLLLMVYIAVISAMPRAMCVLTLSDKNISLTIPFKKRQTLPYTKFSYVQHGYYLHVVKPVHFIVFSQYRISNRELSQINLFENSQNAFKVRYTKRMHRRLCSVLPNHLRIMMDASLRGAGCCNSAARLRQLHL